VGSSLPDGPAHRQLVGSCCASARTALGPVPTWRPPDGDWPAAPSPSQPPDPDPVLPSPARVERAPAGAAFSEITAAHPEAVRVPPVTLPARRHTTARLHGCANGSGQIPLPCAGSLPRSSGLPVPDTSSPRAPRSRRCALAVAHFQEEVPPLPFAATPNLCCDQIAAPGPPVHSRSAAPVPPATSLLPEPFHDHHNASTGPEVEPPLRSATRPPPRPCRGPVVEVPRSADNRRSPDTDQDARLEPLRSASADRWPPTMPASAVDAPVGAHEAAPDAAQVGEVPAASLASRAQLQSAPDSLWDCAATMGSVSGSDLESML
jgi:hypothetical protein